MRALLLQLDGKLPNLALMRASYWFKEKGFKVTFRHCFNFQSAERKLWDKEYDRILASLIFTRTRPLAERLKTVYPHAIFGGTGWNLRRLYDAGIQSPEKHLDYSIYPGFKPSMGFTQRGCRLKCPFCVVPEKEGAVFEINTIRNIWRGGENPKDIILLDNDFFGSEHWRERIEELRDGYRVNFCQGINARMLTEETAKAIASVSYWDSRFKRRCLYTAWDNRKDERRLFLGLEALVAAGVKPREIMVYMLIGYWSGETDKDWEYRRSKLREFGCDPYPMPYERTSATVGFQRFVCGAYDKRVSWDKWKKANYRPEKL